MPLRPFAIHLSMMVMVVNGLAFYLPRESLLASSRTLKLTNSEPRPVIFKDTRVHYYNKPLSTSSREEYKIETRMSSSLNPIIVSSEQSQKEEKMHPTSKEHLMDSLTTNHLLSKQNFPSSSDPKGSKLQGIHAEGYWRKRKGTNEKKMANISKNRRLFANEDLSHSLIPIKYANGNMHSTHYDSYSLPALEKEADMKYQLGKDIIDKELVYNYKDYSGNEPSSYSNIPIISLRPEKNDYADIEMQTGSSKLNSELLPSAQRRLALSGEKYHARDRKHIGPLSDDWDSKDLRFTTITVGSLMIFLIFIVMVLALRVHCRNREKAAQEWIRHPIVQPTTSASGAVQPNLKHILNSNQPSSEPVRIKAKGLLERRGSNTSLTIDLGSSAEGGPDATFASSKECTPEDFLMTAGSRMGRRQLRLCLRDPRDLHSEFWQIPTNHPDKCSVPGAAAKNRYRTVLPNEETRVIMRNAPPDSPETPASQYINANYIRGYDGEERAYIAMQGPLAHTIEDLWLLVMQERCPAVVMITRLKEKGRVKCEPYVPNYSSTYGSIQVTVKQVIQKNGYTIRQIFFKRGDEVHTTLHFWFTTWPDHKAPTSARHLLAMAAEVETARKDAPRGPVAVHCSAGIGRTGCFIAISIGIHQLLEEDCVDVLSIVCQMRLDRGGMVQTAEQYEFIHRALAFYEATLPCTSSAE